VHCADALDVPLDERELLAGLCAHTHTRVSICGCE
jgi:hypothetical protein